MKNVFVVFVCLLLGVSLQAQNNALDFDGVDDYVIMPSDNAFQLLSGTIELWVKPKAFVQGQAMCILSNRGPGGTRYSFHLGSNTIGLWNGTWYFPVTYTAGFTPGAWYHLAFVWNANDNTVQYYVNGSYLGKGNTEYGYNQSVTGQPLVIGAVKEGANAQEFFNGAIDEVRMWSTNRTAAEILQNKDLSMNGTESGLVALYNFDQGTAMGSNTAISAVSGLSSNVAGALNNFALTGNTSNFVAGFSTVTPTTPPSGTTAGWSLTGNSGTNPTTNAIGTTDNTRLVFKANNTEKMSLMPSGFLGIGTSAPAATLDVNGNIFSSGKIAIGTSDMTKISSYSLAVNGDAIFNRVKVKLYSNWPDFVFTKNYRLRSLSEVETYIKSNSHLPGVPSAMEVRLNNLDIAENQAILLRKIEELTLYLIQQNKRIAAQQQEINTLKKKMAH